MQNIIAKSKTVDGKKYSKQFNKLLRKKKSFTVVQTSKTRKIVKKTQKNNDYIDRLRANSDAVKLVDLPMFDVFKWLKHYETFQDILNDKFCPYHFCSKKDQKCIKESFERREKENLESFQNILADKSSYSGFTKKGQKLIQKSFGLHEEDSRIDFFAQEKTTLLIAHKNDYRAICEEEHGYQIEIDDIFIHIFSEYEDRAKWYGEQIARTLTMYPILLRNIEHCKIMLTNLMVHYPKAPKHSIGRQQLEEKIAYLDEIIKQANGSFLKKEEPEPEETIVIEVGKYYRLFKKAYFSPFRVIFMHRKDDKLGIVYLDKNKKDVHETVSLSYFNNQVCKGRIEEVK